MTPTTDPAAIAAHFVRARATRQGFADFPGTLPDTLEAAYAVQQAEIEQWPDAVAGWKVGRLSPDLAARCGTDRFLGPIFAATVARLGAEGAAPCDFPAFPNGFAAFEAEVLVGLARDAAPDRADWTAADAAALAGPMHIGVEVAGSPLAGIARLGSLASVCGFGNNAGLIVGPEIPGWRGRDAEPLTCTVTVDGAVVGDRRRDSLTAGALEGLAFALGQAARMGRPLRAGQWVSTGALTGVHAVTDGALCRADFGAYGSLTCMVRARP